MVAFNGLIGISSVEEEQGGKVEGVDNTNEMGMDINNVSNKNNNDVGERETTIRTSISGKANKNKQQKGGSLFMSGGDGGYRLSGSKNNAADQIQADKAPNDNSYAQSFRHMLEKRPIYRRSRMSSLTSVQSGISDDSISDHIKDVSVKRRVSFSNNSNTDA